MKYKKQISRYISYLMIFVFHVISCDNPGNLPAPSNPYDPSNPNYEPPQAIITGGAWDGDTISTSKITFTWEGNEIAGDFSYRFNLGSWSEWSTLRSATFNYLNEETYRFDIRARANNSIKTMGDTTTVFFTVDAVKGPSLLFYPRYQEIMLNSLATLEIKAEEVDKIMGIEAGISYDTTKIRIVSISPGDFMKQNGGELIFFSEINESDGIIDIVSVCAGGYEATVTGTGVIAYLTIESKTIGITQLDFMDLCVFRDDKGMDIMINEMESALIKIM